MKLNNYKLFCLLIITKGNKELQLQELTKYKLPKGKNENEKVTKCPKEILKKIKSFKDVTFFEGTINSHNWKGTPRHLTPYIDVFTRVIY